MSKILTYITYSFLWLFSLLPLRLLYFFSDILYLLNRYVIKYREKVILTNLRNSFPEKSETEIISIKNRFNRHLTDFLFESIKMITISKKKLDKHYIFENLGLLEDLLKEKKSLSIISGHYANWEWSFSLPKTIKRDFLVIYQPLKNTRADMIFKKVRGRFNGELIAMNDYYKRLVEKHGKGESGSSYFIGDQRPAGAKRIHYWRKFLNQDTAFYLGPEKASIKYDHAVVFMDIQKQKRSRYSVTFELLFKNSSETKPYEITDAFVDKLESVIRDKPDYWLWSHKRWKNSR